MNSIKTTANYFAKIKNNNKCIGGFVMIPYLEDGFKLYVAWEWEEQAKLGFFAITTLYLSEITNDRKLADLLNECADYGEDVTHLPAVQRLFPNLF
jgi:hypothetical protein